MAAKPQLTAFSTRRILRRNETGKQQTGNRCQSAWLSFGSLGALDAMILDRPLIPEEKAYLEYWKTVCGKCFGWSRVHTERWVKREIDDFDYHLSGFLYHQHPLERIQRLFVPEHLREKFRLGKLNGLREFYDGLEDVLMLPWSEIDTGFSAEFDWDAARQKVARLTEIFASQNRE